MYINKVTLYGNLTRDPELRALPNGGSVASFGLATSRKYRNKGEEVEQTEFHNVVAFGKVSEVMAQYLKKGRAVFLEGRLQTRTWEKDGVKQYRTEVIVESFQFGPSQGGEKHDRTPDPEKGYSSHMEGQVDYPEEVNPEDIPF